MCTDSQSTKAEASAKPGLVPSDPLAFPAPGSATESTTPARPGPSPANTTALPQATTSQQNATFTSSRPQANLMQHGASIFYPAGSSGSAVDSRPLKHMAYSAPCSYCRVYGHSDDICRRRKRCEGCISCGEKGHLAHQCNTGGGVCRYCFKPGHSDVDCFYLKMDLKNDTNPCTYCSKLGHQEHRCDRKRRDLASNGLRASTVHAASDSLGGAPTPSQSPVIRTVSRVAAEERLSHMFGSMGAVAAAGTRNASYGSRYLHRVPVSQSGNGATTIRNVSAQTKLEAEPGRFQVQQPPSHALPVNYNLTPIDGADPSVQANKDINSNSFQMPTRQVMAECAVQEPTSKREESKSKPRGGPDASATTKRSKKSVSSSPIVYGFRDAIHNNRVQNTITTNIAEGIEFHRKLMKERYEEAKRLRRAQNHAHG